MNNSVKQEKLQAAQCEEAINVCCVLCTSIKLCVRVWCRFDVNRIHNQHSTKAGRWWVQQTRTSIEQWTVRMRAVGVNCQCACHCLWAVVEWTGPLHESMLEGQALRLTPHPMRFEMLIMRVQFGHECCTSWTNGQQHGTHASGNKLHTEHEYTSTCTSRLLYSYSIPALTISGCGQLEAAGTIRATSYEDRHTFREARRLRSTRTCRFGRPPASSPSARSADSERSSARSRASAPVAPRRPPRSHKQSASRSFTCSALKFAQRRTQSSRQEHSERLTRAVEH